MEVMTTVSQIFIKSLGVDVHNEYKNSFISSSRKVTSRTQIFRPKPTIKTPIPPSRFLKPTSSKSMNRVRKSFKTKNLEEKLKYNFQLLNHTFDNNSGDSSKFDPIY